MSLRDDLLRLFPALSRVAASGYVVGGAIRDLMRNEQPADVDVACADPLACAQSLGRKVIRLGKDHLSAYRVVVPPHVYDFAEILDGNIVRDLARRDFTVNAMAVALGSGELLDPHGGRDDVARRLVRMVDAANFDDDPLRVLKAVRMAVRLGFTIDPATLDAARQRAASVAGIAPERVTYELSIIFQAGAFRRAVALFRETALGKPLFGRELDPSHFHADDVPLPAAFAVIVEDPRASAERWRWSNQLLREVVAIQRLLRLNGDLRVALYDAGERTSRDFVQALRALGRSSDVEFPDFSLRPLLRGEAIALITGVAPGCELGRIMRAMLEAEIRGEVRTVEEAKSFVRRMRTP